MPSTKPKAVNDWTVVTRHTLNRRGVQIGNQIIFDPVRSPPTIRLHIDGHESPTIDLQPRPCGYEQRGVDVGGMVFDIRIVLLDLDGHRSMAGIVNKPFTGEDDDTESFTAIPGDGGGGTNAGG